MRSHKLIGILALVAATAALNVGCAAQARVSGTAGAEPPVVFVGNPTLVSVDSGVWVVRDSERTAYYVEDSYWVFRDGTWYKSRSYDGGWLVVEASTVPSSIASRDHATYVKYTGDASAPTKPAPRGEVASADPPVPASAPPATGNPHGGPPGQDEIPGVGNQRKADGEQPGHASHADGAPKSDAASSKSDPPGHKDPPGLGKKADGPPPASAGSAASAKPAAAAPASAQKPGKEKDKPKKK